ncbi:MAG TPA: NAD-dependent epimerase/dehydratase family protein [Candidatus Baltobacteraceae bacterium]
MRICILGGDGYLGWPTSMYLSARGHEVLAVDNGAKRDWEAEMDTIPLKPVPWLAERANRWKAATGKTIEVLRGDIAADGDLLDTICRDFAPDTIVHYAEQPSAPYSMLNRATAVYTQVNNVVGTLNVMFAMHKYSPNAHLVKLGTMGEYGTPNIDIEEGWLEVEHNGRSDRMLYPKKPGSLYHLSKVHDSANLEFACRVWGLRVTDLNQGVVYGYETDETAMDPDVRTSFHYDDIFGTTLNRFVVQAAIGMPLTVYGKGGQTRGWINLRDTLRCVELATVSPARSGEFRVFNQFTEQFSIAELAARVQLVARQEGVPCEIQSVPNPRTEQEQHYYNAKHTGLLELGLTPHLLTDEVIRQMLGFVIDAKQFVKTDTIMPRYDWKSGMAIAPSAHEKIETPNECEKLAS